MSIVNSLKKALAAHPQGAQSLGPLEEIDSRPAWDRFVQRVTGTVGCGEEGDGGVSATAKATRLRLTLTSGYFLEALSERGRSERHLGNATNLFIVLASLLHPDPGGHLLSCVACRMLQTGPAPVCAPVRSVLYSAASAPAVFLI